MTPTVQELEVEILEQAADLDALKKARDLVRERVVVSRDATRLLTPLHAWSGSDAVLGSLDMAIHAIERTISELAEMRKTAPVAGVVEQKPVLRLVKGNEDEHQG